MDEFDVRIKIEKEVYKWCKKEKIAAGVMGTIQALGALGYIDLSVQPVVEADAICEHFISPNFCGNKKYHDSKHDKLKRRK